MLSAALDGLSDLLWSQVLVSIDTTTSMGAELRFVTIANSLRPVPLYHYLRRFYTSKCYTHENFIPIWFDQKEL